jgi:hypothetical protein
MKRKRENEEPLTSSSFTSEQIKNLLQEYPSCIEKLSEKKQKTKLIELEDIYFRKLVNTLQQRAADPYLTAIELQNLMEWKLARGKFRPGLLQKVSNNTNMIVEKVTREAFKEINNWPVCLNVLVKGLYGVGPATATAILSLLNPQIPFFSDEASKLILKTNSLKYNVKEILDFVAQMQNKCPQEYTCRELEQSLFVLYHQEKI